MPGTNATVERMDFSYRQMYRGQTEIIGFFFSFGCHFQINVRRENIFYELLAKQ